MPSTGHSSWERWRTAFLLGLTVPLVATVWFFSSRQPPASPGQLEVRLRQEALAIGRLSGVSVQPTTCTYLGKVLTLDCKWPAVAESETLAALTQQGWLSTGDNRSSGTLEGSHEVTFARAQDRAKLHCKRPPAVAECFLSLKLHLGT